LDSKELPELLRKIEVYNGSTITRVAIKLMAMTFVRTSELIGARWEEFDLDGGRWDIPASRMKMKTPHVVPLSTQAVTLLRSLQTLTGHGFRGIASTLLHEQGWPHEHIELQLAHQERNQVSASYNHAMYLQPRAEMMQA